MTLKELCKILKIDLIDSHKLAEYEILTEDDENFNSVDDIAIEDYHKELIFSTQPYSKK